MLLKSHMNFTGTPSSPSLVINRSAFNGMVKLNITPSKTDSLINSITWKSCSADIWLAFVADITRALTERYLERKVHQPWLVFLRCWFFVEGGKPENPEKNSRSKEKKNNNKLDPHVLWHRAGIEPRPHWWETSALTTVPTLLKTGFHVRFCGNLERGLVIFQK